MVDQYADDLRYAPSRGSWLRWAGTRWAWCEDDGEPVQAAIATIQNLPADGEDDTVRRKLAEPRAFAHRQAH